MAKKILIGFLLFFSTTVIVLAVAYNLMQSKIQSKVVALINETIKGSVEIENLSYSFFSSYPYLIVDIDTLKLREYDNADKQIIEVYGLHAKIDVSAAIRGNYVINEVSIGSGEAFLINKIDSSLNLLNAIAFVDADTATEQPIDPLNLAMEKFILTDFNINYQDKITDQAVYSKVNNLSMNASLVGDSLSSNVDVSYKLDSFLIGDQRIIKNQRLTYKSAIKGDISKTYFAISNGKIKLNLLTANVEGSFNGANNGFVDINIWAQHTDLSDLAKMEIFKEENLPEIKHGVLEIDASIKGYVYDESPLIEATASLKGLEIFNKFGKVIDDVRFGLSFKSLSNKSFNDSHLVIDSLLVKLTSGGVIKARAKIDHLNKPRFSITWQASEELENIGKLVELPGIKSIGGKVRSNGSYAGTYTIATQKLSDYTGAFNVVFKNANVILKKGDYPITNINGSAYVVNGDVGLENLSFNANTNNIMLNGKVENFLPFVFNVPTELTSSIAIKSDVIKTESLLAFDKALADSNKYVIREFDVNLQAELSSKSLVSYNLVPTGKLRIYNFTALVDGVPPISTFEGVISVDQNLIAIKDFKGVIGKSHVDFSVSVSNYSDFLQSENEKQIIVDASLKSEQINVKDFFTVNEKFILPKSYKEEVLKEVEINTKIITTNFQLQKTELLPEFELQVTGLQFRTLYTPVVFKNIFVFGMVKDNNVYVNSMFGKFGRSDVFMNAQFDNVVATKDTVSRPLKSRVTFNSGVLDLNELIKLEDSDSIISNSASTEEVVASNPFADSYPITDFQLNIGELNYYDATIKHIEGLIQIEENNLVHLHEVKLQSGEFGTFEFDGTLDASSRTEAILKSTIKISDVDLSKLNVTYLQDGEEVKISDHFAGQVNGNINANVPLLQDFSFDLARLTGKVKVIMTDGALINYAPLEEMGNYFKNKDLTNVQFDELKNTMIFNKGKILLPFMTINTTLGTINLMGFQNLENEMEYDIQVPVKLVAGSALNSLFSSKKGDDSKEDEIKKGGKGKYVTVHISGSDDGFKFKLGKKHVLTAPPGFIVD